MVIQSQHLRSFHFPRPPCFAQLPLCSMFSVSTHTHTHTHQVTHTHTHQVTHTHTHTHTHKVTHTHTHADTHRHTSLAVKLPCNYTQLREQLHTTHTLHTSTHPKHYYILKHTLPLHATQTHTQTHTHTHTHTHHTNPSTHT